MALVTQGKPAELPKSSQLREFVLGTITLGPYPCLIRGEPSTATSLNQYNSLCILITVLPPPVRVAFTSQQKSFLLKQIQTSTESHTQLISREEKSWGAQSHLTHLKLNLLSFCHRRGGGKTVRARRLGYLPLSPSTMWIQGTELKALASEDLGLLNHLAAPALLLLK